MNTKIRWQQRLANYSKALRQLERAVVLSEERDLSDLEEQGLIQAFEFTHEMPIRRCPYIGMIIQGIPYGL